MIITKRLSDWQALRRGLTGTVGFVPTMGALHAGHRALIEQSVAENDHTVLSIYVNPTQFNNAEDLDNYPCTLEADLDLARQLGVQHVLMPRYAEMYPDGYRYRVDETEFSNELCGAYRPGHFTGVLTVVMKLLNLVKPNRAYFGEKDFQQLTLIRDMADAFFMDVEIVPVATVREEDGLALSSRNARLSKAARRHAPKFSALLNDSSDDASVRKALEALGFDVDYVETKRGRRFGAVTMDCGSHDVRLIDNVPSGDVPNGAAAG